MAYNWDPPRKQGLLVVFLVAGTTLLWLALAGPAVAGPTVAGPAAVAGALHVAVAGALPVAVPAIMDGCLHVL